MAFNGVQITEFKNGRTPTTGTPALGSIFQNEFVNIYNDLNELHNGSGLADGAIETERVILNDSIKDEKLHPENKMGLLTALKSTSVGGDRDSIVAALNFVLTLLESEITNRQTADDQKNFIRALLSNEKIQIKDEGNLLYWSKNDGVTWNPFA